MSDHRLEIVLAAKDITGTAFTKVTGRVKALVSGVTSLQGGLLGLAGVGGFGAVAGGALSTARAFERYQVQLKTLTGSQEAAKASMAWITEFTRTTPYELDEVTAAFAKLTAYGLDAPTWMRSLGDTASSMGKSLNDAVEMFADAVTGEFERLKEFGVRAKQQGDQVTFSWSQNGKDMVLTADKTQSGISNALGEIFKRFKGGMQEQSRTFDGLWSNMMDTYTSLERKVMDAGVFDAIKDGISDVNQQLSTWIENNDELIAQKVPEYIDDIKDSVSGLYNFYKGLPDEVVGAAGAGILGRILFGSWGVAKYVALASLMKDITEEMGNKILKAGGKAPVDGAGGMLEELFDPASQIERQIEAARKRAQQNLDDLKGWRGKLFPDTYRRQYEEEMATVERLTQKLNKLNIAREFDGLSGYADNDAREAAWNNRRPAARSGGASAVGMPWIAAGDEEFFGIEAIAKSWKERRKAFEKIGTKDGGSEEIEGLQEFQDLAKEYAQKVQDDANALIDTWDRVDADLENFFSDIENGANETADAMRDAFMGWGAEFSSTLNDAVWGADLSFKSIAESFGKMITQMMIQKQVVEPIFTSLFTTNAQGNIYGYNGLIPFASGGIVTKPTTFPFASGIGLMGEAGPEAIMPLTRTSTGNLGVEAKTAAPNIEVIINPVNESGMQLDVQPRIIRQSHDKVVADMVIKRRMTSRNFRQAMGG